MSNSPATPSGPAIAQGHDDARALRDVLGCFGTGVTVVTAQTPGGPLGITANSFASVSLEPPLVLWSPAMASRRFAAFEAAAHFAIHVLHEGQLELARAFSASGDAFGGTGWEFNTEGVPVLTGCLARIECQKVAAHDAGDHAIIVAQVLRSQRHPGRPLLFVQGEYGRFSPGLDGA